MHDKKKLIARLSCLSGATRLLESLPGSSSLLILNYHRVGDAQTTPYDSGTFSCTAPEFDWQVAYLKKHFTILNLHEALKIVSGDAAPEKPQILLTFDDGYLDSYEEAFPILRRHNVSATFFLPTAFVGTGRLPWWDQIAFIAKRSKTSTITLTYPALATFDLSPASRAQSIIGILNHFKHPRNSDSEHFLRGLEAACQCPRPENAARCFLTWDDARKMQEAGMSFGSHTHTHEILARLPYEAQLDEVTTSRAIMERELGTVIDTLAYPVGKADTFSQDTVKALQAAGYTAAFSFKGGINLSGSVKRYDVLRTGIFGEERSVFRMRVAALAGLHRGIV